MADLVHRLSQLVAPALTESDGTLLGRFTADRDGEAFAELVRRHGPMVFAVCRRVLRHRQDAEDAFQATFLVLARRAGVVKPRASVGSWLYGVAYRTAVGARRVAAARQAREARAGAMRETDTAPVDPSSDLREALDRELAALPDACRAAVVACDLEGLSRREAATRLGWAEGTLSSRLARGRSILARRLKSYGLAVPAAGLGVVMGPAAGALPPGLADATVRLGVLMAAGEAVATAPVAALTEEIMKAMLLTKLKGMTAVLVVGCAVLVTAGAGWRANAVGAADPPGDSARPAAAAARTPRDADKERIAELERERDQLRKEVAELKDRLDVIAAEQKAARAEAREAIARAERARIEADANTLRPNSNRTTGTVAAPAPVNVVPSVRTVDPNAGTPPAVVSAPPASVPATPAPVAETRPAGVPIGPGSTTAAPRATVKPTFTESRPPDPAPRNGTWSPTQAFPVPVPQARASELFSPRPETVAAPVADSVVRVYPAGDVAPDAKEGEALVKVIRATVAPHSWGVNAGVEYLPGRKVLVIRQSPQGHEEVGQLLRLLKAEAPDAPTRPGKTGGLPPATR